MQQQVKMTPNEMIDQEIEDIFTEIDKITSKVYLYKYTYHNKPTVERIKHLGKTVVTLRNLMKEMDAFEPEELPY
jgi:hypothetical protein